MTKTTIDEQIEAIEKTIDQAIELLQEVIARGRFIQLWHKENQREEVSFED